MALGSGDSKKTDDQIKAADFTKKLFEIAKKGSELSVCSLEPNTPLQIPILEDWYGITALDYALGLSKQDQYEGIFKPSERVAEKAEEQINLTLASIIFENIA